jgi:hypothetical protein
MWPPTKKTKQQEETQSMLELAKKGDKQAQSFFSSFFRLKVYTEEELKLVNLLLRKTMSEPINVKDKDLVVEVPDITGDLHPCKLNWIKDLGNRYFLGGLSYLEGYPWGGGHSIYTLKLDPEVGFKPLFDACWVLDYKEELKNHEQGETNKNSTDGSEGCRE